MAQTAVYLEITAEPKGWFNPAFFCFCHLCAITDILFGERFANRLSDVECALLVRYAYRISASPR